MPTAGGGLTGGIRTVGIDQMTSTIIDIDGIAAAAAIDRTVVGPCGDLIVAGARVDRIGTAGRNAAAVDLVIAATCADQIEPPKRLIVSLPPPP